MDAFILNDPERVAEIRAAMQRDIEDRKARLFDPESFEKELERRAVNSRYDQEIADATAVGLEGRLIDSLEELRASDLEKVDSPAADIRVR